MSFEIIDFHTHPFLDASQNICSHKDVIKMDYNHTLNVYKELGVSKICGSVIKPNNKVTDFSCIKENNNIALKLKEIYGEFYIPGFSVNPDFLEDSLKEIERMHSLNINLMGELVPYFDNWQNNYASCNFDEILNVAGKYNMVVNLHSMDNDALDEMVKKHKDVIFVAAHPGEYNDFMRHIERQKFSENYYLDISGYGIFRYGMLKRAVDAFSCERIIFGSDYPTCNPGMYIGGVLNDNLLTDTQKEKILSLNAKKILNIK